MKTAYTVGENICKLHIQKGINLIFKWTKDVIPEIGGCLLFSKGKSHNIG